MSLPTEKLNDLATALYKTRLSGDTIRNTLNLVAQASDGMGDDVGNAFKDIVTRGQLVNRLQINPFELIGKGVDFTDVAASLSKNLGIGINDAKRALAEGRVPLDAGAKALRDAIEKRFGATNALKVKDLDVQFKRLGTNLSRMTRDVNLEPLVNGLSKIFSNFDEGTVAGTALKEIITDVGNGISKTFEGGAPKVTHFIKQGIIGALDLEIAYLKLKRAFESTFGKDAAGKIGDFTSGLVSIRYPLDGIATIFTAIGTTLDKLKAAKDWLSDWKSTGTQASKGLVDGFSSSEQELTKAVTGMADNVKKTFRGALGIHSPSKEFEKDAKHSVEGYTRGLDKGAPAVQGAVNAMAPSARGGGGGSVAAGGIALHFHIEPGADRGAVTALKQAVPSIVDQIAKVFEEMRAQHGGGVAEMA